MFDGHDAMQLEAARGHWKTMKADGNTVTYWQRDVRQEMERKA